MTKPFINLNQHQLQAMLQNAVHTPADQQNYNQKILHELYGHQTPLHKFQQYLKGNPAYQFHLVSDGGQIKVIDLPTKAQQNICIIDWINITVNAESFNTEIVLTDHDLILLASETLQTIFGFGITIKNPNSAFFYSDSYQLGDNYGLVCYGGGQNNTILISVNATGLMNASPDWELRLYHFLEVSISPTITRVDLAHDIFNAPDYLIDFYLTVYDKGGFTNYRNKPSLSQAGNWLTPNTDGRTLYIGNRKSGLYLRIYEKGRELKSLDYPTWLRLEAELKSDNRFIPHDVLLRPHDYFAGLYPCFRSFNRQFERIETFKNELKSDFNERIKWGKHQTGGLIKLLTELGYQPEQVLQFLQGEKIPKQWQRKFFGNTKNPIHDEPAVEVFQRNFAGIPL